MFAAIVAAAAEVNAGDLSRVADSLGEGVGAAHDIERGVDPAALDEAVKKAGAVLVSAGDLSRGADAIDVDVGAARGIDRRVDPAALDEAVLVAAVVEVNAGDLSRVVDRPCDGALLPGKSSVV